MYIKMFCLGCFLLFSGCGGGDVQSEGPLTQEVIAQHYAIERLKNETFYFPANNRGSETVFYQPLQRFDLIFVGHEVHQSDYTGVDMARAIPGTYTHVLAYLGKDDNGLAYAMEMNSDAEVSYTFGAGGLRIGGRPYVYCMGADFNLSACLVDDHIYGLETYDYKVARRADAPLYEALLRRERELLMSMKEDLKNALPFALPLALTPSSLISKTVRLVDDGRVGGADCTSYFTSLFEETAGVCFDDDRINARQLTDYFTLDSEGRGAIIPEAYNFFTGDGDLYMYELLGPVGYRLVDNEPRKSACADGRVLQGIPTPDRLFHSPDMVEIAPVVMGSQAQVL